MLMFRVRGISSFDPSLIETFVPGYRRGRRETKQELYRANQRQKCGRRRKIFTAITSPEGERCDGEEQKFDLLSSDKWRPIIRNHWKKSKTSWSVLSLSSCWSRAHRRTSSGGAQEGAQVKIALNNGQPLMRMYRNLNYQATQCPQSNKEKLTVALKKENITKCTKWAESTSNIKQTLTNGRINSYRNSNFHIKDQLNIPTKTHFTQVYKQFRTWGTIHETWARQRIPFLLRSLLGDRIICTPPKCC